MKGSLQAKGVTMSRDALPECLCGRILRDVYTHKDPEIHQMGTMNEANQNDWPRENGKKYLI